MQIQKGKFTWNGTLTPVAKEKFDSIALHHMAHPDADEYEVEKWHKNKGWIGFGYNYWIGLDGRIIEGRGLNQGAGVEKHNSHIISIGFQGNYEPFDPNVKYFTDMPKSQFDAGVWLIKYLKSILPNIKYIDGHCRWNATSCPGRYFPLKQMIDAVEKEPQKPHWGEETFKYLTQYITIHEKRFDDNITRAETFALLAQIQKQIDEIKSRT